MNNTFWIAVGVLALTLLLLLGYQHEKIDDLENKLTAFGLQIATVKQESTQALAQVKQAHTQADQAINLVNQKSAAVMNEKVSPNCDAAIKWAIEQAKVMNK